MFNRRSRVIYAKQHREYSRMFVAKLRQVSERSGLALQISSNAKPERSNQVQNSFLQTEVCR